MSSLRAGAGASTAGIILALVLAAAGQIAAVGPLAAAADQAPGPATPPAIAPASAPATSAPESPVAPSAPAAQAAPPVRRPECSRPTGPAIPASALLERIRAGEDVVVDGQVIEGSLDLDAPGPGATPPGGGTRADRVVAGRLVLVNSLVAGRVAFPRAVFAKGFELRCTEVGGDLDLSEAIVRGGAVLTDMRITGAARLGGVHVSGDLSLDRTRFLDQLDLSRTEIAGRMTLARATLPRGAEAAAFTAGAVDFSWSDASGPLVLRDGVVLGDLAVVDADLRRGLTIANMRVVGRLDLREARVAGGATLEGVHVGVDFLGGVERADALEMRDCRIARRMSLFDARIVSMHLSEVNVDFSVEWDDARFTGDVRIERSRLGESFSADGALFGGQCEIRSSRLPGEEPFAGAEFKYPVTLIDTDMPIPARAGDPAGESDDPDDDNGSGGEAD